MPSLAQLGCLLRLKHYFWLPRQLHIGSKTFFFVHKCISDLENNFEKLGNSLDVQTVSRTSVNFWVLKGYQLAFVIVPLLYKMWHMLTSYCKFIMPKGLKWSILCLCILIPYQDIHKKAWQYLKIFLMDSPGFVNFSNLTWLVF